MSKCLRCDGQRIVWEINDLGQAVCSPCPTCNKNGEAIRKEQAEMDRLFDQVRQEAAALEKRAVNE